MLEKFPASVKECSSATPRRNLKKDDLIFQRSCWWTSSSPAMMLEEAAAAQVAEMGFKTIIDNRCDDWGLQGRGQSPARSSAARGEVRKASVPDFRREVTVTVDAEAGRGGRNQQMVLMRHPK